MKHWLVFLVCCVVLLQVAGCESAGRPDSSGVEVTVEDDGEFPEPLVVQESGFPANLAGTWKADVSKWSITLGPEGEIISSINEAGMNMVMAEGGLLQEGGGGNRYLVFQFGDSFTEYNRESRKLTATINIESLSMVFQERIFEGDMKYVISGSISDDGNRWLADVETYMTLENLKSGDKPATVERLLFRKVDVD